MDLTPPSGTCGAIFMHALSRYREYTKTPFYLWRPFLRDPNDDMVVEAAVTGGCDSIVTFNSRDFAGVEQFRIRVMTPREFLFEFGELE